MASSLNLSWEADPARRERLINEAVDRTMPAARAGALAELRSLALVPANKKMMWSDSSVKSALLAGAKESETVSVRESSLATLYLLSPRSSGINGQGIVVDAGMSSNYFDDAIVGRDEG